MDKVKVDEIKNQYMDGMITIKECYMKIADLLQDPVEAERLCQELDKNFTAGIDAAL